MASVAPSGTGESRRPLSGSTNFTSSNLRHSQSARPSSPHTPQHQLRSNNNSFASTSSGSTFRGEEDAIIFELGSRWLRAGFEGESTPMCVVGFGPEESRRAGDYRGWLKGSLSADASQKRSVKMDDWTGAYELWRIDLRDVDLGLVEDKVERVFREAYNKYLLTDVGTSRLVLVVPSLMPHPLLSAVLSTLFNRWRFPSITLVSGATMSTVAAGVRSALVVDLGWAETTVTGVYEYREIATKRSTRAMKTLLQMTGKSLTQLAPKRTREPAQEDSISVNFEYCEEIVSRLAWCKPRSPRDQQTQDTPTEATDAKDEETLQSLLEKPISIPSPSNPGSEYIDVPFSTFADPVEKVIFADGVADCDLDDEEIPIPLLVYNTLLALPPDVRGTCMSRMIFVGGGSHIPGIRKRILGDVASLVDKHGWSPVRGQIIERQRQRLQDLSLTQEPKTTDEPSPSSPPDTHEKNEEKAKHEESEIDFVEQRLRRNNRDKDLHPPVHGTLREVESLGPWAGASLMTSVKIRGLVEIEREKFLQHGLAGASREVESHGHVPPDRRSGLRSGGDRSSWTLAGWA